MRRLGVDLGYGWVKVYPKKEKFRTSVYPYSSRLGIEDRKGIVMVDGEVFEVGRARSVELRTKGFHNSPEWKALLFWALREHTDTPLDLVMGLPVSGATKEVREGLERELKGEHIAIIDGERKRVVIRNIKVIPQGMGVLYDYFIESGSLMKERTEESVVVIDVGFYTTDVFVYRHGEVLEDRCSSYELGAGWLFEQIREELKTKYSYPSISLKEVEEFYRRGYFPYEGKKIPVEKGKYEELFRNRLIKELRAHEEDIKLADTILWAGGGSLLLGVPAVEEPEFANARGYFKLAGMIYGG